MAIRTGLHGYSFTVLRTLEFISLLVIIALTGRLASQLNKANAPTQPAPVTWTITVATLFAVWTLVTLTLHVIGSIIRYIITTVLDLILFPFLIVCTVLIARPIRSIDCAIVGSLNHEITTLSAIFMPDSATTSDAQQLYPYNIKAFPAYTNPDNSPGESIIGLMGLNSDLGGPQGNGTSLATATQELANYRQWVGRVEMTCTHMKAVFALLVLVVIMTFATATIAFLIWRKSRRIPELRPGEYDGGYTGRVSEESGEEGGRGGEGGAGGGGDGWTGMGVQVPIQVPTRTEEEAKMAVEEEERERLEEMERRGRTRGIVAEKENGERREGA